MKRSYYLTSGLTIWCPNFRQLYLLQELVRKTWWC